MRGTLAGLAAGNASGNIPESNGVVNKNLNADLLDGYEASAFAAASHTHSAATTSTAGLMSAADKTKMDGIAIGAQVNQNAFSNVVVGTTTLQADSVTDTLTLTAGTNISLTPDATNDAVMIAVSGTVPSAITATTCSGNAATATALATGRTFSVTGDATGTSAAFTGAANASIPITLAASGITAGTYTSVTVDAKGRVTGGANPTSMGISITGNAVTATKLATARSISLTGAVTGTTTFDGSGDASIATVAVSGGVPVGTYIESACTSVPAGGYLYCDGSSVSRTTYTALFAAIGTTYGVGDGSTTFNLPDRRDRFALARGTSHTILGSTGGEETHTLNTAEMPSHSHSCGVAGSITNTGGGGYYYHYSSGISGSTGGGGAHNTMPPYLVVNIYIKY